ncbi:MAG: MotA/TolQ/ExbB proton channel family protein [Eubacteriales bacterium]
MNLTYIIGVVGALAIMIAAMMFTTDDNGDFAVSAYQLGNFIDPTSIMIVVGCTLMVIIASAKPSDLKSIPKHFKIMLNAKLYDPMVYIDQLVDLAQVARKNGLLALEEQGAKQEDPFFKFCIMQIVDNNDPDKVKDVMLNDLDQGSARHGAGIAIYKKGEGVGPAMGMIGTLVGLVNMLANMGGDSSDGMGSLASDMGVAMITTLYGCIVAHIVFGPIAANLTTRNQQELLCKEIIVEGIMAIQSGANPKSIREKLLTFVATGDRSDAPAGGGE